MMTQTSHNHRLPVVDTSIRTKTSKEPLLLEGNKKITKTTQINKQIFQTHKNSQLL